MVYQMIKRKAEFNVQKSENMRGGQGVATLVHLLTPEELYEKGRLYAKIILEPGCSIGSHVHDGEMESYYILCGEAEINDNGELVTVYAGDSVLTLSGQEHSVKNTGSDTLEFMALIIYK